MNMSQCLYRAEDLIDFVVNILVHPNVGVPEKQAAATARILVEADLRGDPDHGILGGNSIDDICRKVNDDVKSLGFKRICTPEYLRRHGKKGDFTYDRQIYPTIINVNANGLLGHYVALEMIPEVTRKAKQFGYVKAYIRNSTHFGNCGIYSEMIAENDLAAKVTSTSPAWTKPFVALQKDETENRQRYIGVKKRFGTNPIAWSIPYDEGIITIDMAATQRAVSPAIDVAKFNAVTLGMTKTVDGQFVIGKGERKTPLRQVHLPLSRIDTENDLKNKLADFGYETSLRLISVEKGLLKGPEGEDIFFPLAFDDVFKEQFWIAPLGGTYFGYKGFGLNMLIELDNVVGGGEKGLIRKLDSDGRPRTPERVSHTIEAYAIDGLIPLEKSKGRIGKAVRVTRECGNALIFLPGEKEQTCRKERIKLGIPMSAERLDRLRKIADDVGVPFDLEPIVMNS
jgi:LDH2 family malate/lactate/ureidoglycolate dehydrogenase